MSVKAKKEGDHEPDLLEAGVAQHREREWIPPAVPMGRLGQRTREGWEPYRTPPSLRPSTMPIVVRG